MTDQPMSDERLAEIEAAVWEPTTDNLNSYEGMARSPYGEWRSDTDSDELIAEVRRLRERCDQWFHECSTVRMERDAALARVADLEAEILRRRRVADTEYDQHCGLLNRFAKMEWQRDRAVKAATDLAVALERVLDEYRQAQSDMEYERGDCHDWTTGEAIAELPLGVARIIKLYVTGDGIDRLKEND